MECLYISTMNVLDSDIITLNYQQESNLLISSWKDCSNAEQFVYGIKSCRALCDQVKLSNSLWHFNDYSFVIPPDLQKWADDFLDAPIMQKNNGLVKVAFVVGSDLTALLSAVDLVEAGTAGIQPRYFGAEQQALDYLLAKQEHKTMEQQPLSMPNLSFRIDKVEPNKSQILIDLNSEEIHQYLFLLNRLLKSRTFAMQHVSRFAKLTNREKEVLHLILHDRTTERIAQMLFISLETVKTHRKNISRKLECKSLRELIKYAVFFSGGCF